MINPYQILYYLILIVPLLLIFTIIFLVLRDDNRIYCYIINRNHEIRRTKVNPNYESFKDRNSIYMIPSDCVTLSSTVRGLNPRAELFFVEDNPLPINFKAPNEESDPNVWMVDKIVLEMVLENTSKPKSEFLNFILGYLSDPKKLLLLVFVGMIITALLKPSYVQEVVEMIPR